MAETGRDGGTGTSVAWTACAAEDAAEAGPRGEVAASTHPAPSPPTLLTTLPKIAVLSASGGLVDSSSLVGVGMIGLHPMFQLAWGPFSAHLGPNRAAQLQRYRYKRMLRLQAISRGERKIRYQCRKQLADARPRVKGRFVKTCAGDVHGETRPSHSDNTTSTVSTNAAGSPVVAMKDNAPGGMAPQSRTPNLASGPEKGSTTGARKARGRAFSSKGPKQSPVGTFQMLASRFAADDVSHPVAARKATGRKKQGYSSHGNTISRVRSDVNFARFNNNAPGPTERATTSAYEMFERVDEAKHPCEVMIGDMNQDDLRELDNMIGLFTRQDTRRLLQDIAAADMRRSFSDTNLLNLDPSGFDVASMLGPVEEDELLGF